MFDNLKSEDKVNTIEKTHFSPPESTDIIMLTSSEADILHCKTNVSKGHDTILVFWPVLVTLGGTLLNDPVQHDDGLAVLLPDHGPEVRSGACQWALGQDVRPVQRVHRHQASVDVVGVGDVA